MRALLPYALCALAALAASTMCAGEPAAATLPDELDRAISETLAKPEYAWRLARATPETHERDATVIGAFFRKAAELLARMLDKLADLVGNILGRLLDWLSIDLPQPRSGINWHSTAQGLMFVLLACVTSFLAIFLYRMWKRRQKPATINAQPMAALPLIEDENTSASELPSREWLKMAADLMARGETRLAVRAMFFACLAHLEYRDKLVIARHKSNRDYIRELDRKAHDLPLMLNAFRENTALLEQAWYGMHTVTPAMVAAFEHNKDTILNENTAT